MRGKASIVLMTCIMIFLFFHPVSAIDIPMGTTAPGFALQSIDGKTFSLNQYKGSIVILIYWKSNQPRSLLALKDAQDILRRFNDRSIRVIGLIAGTGDSGMAARILKNNDIDFPVLLDSDRQVFGDYGIHVYPSTVVIDKGGEVAYSLAGHAMTYKTALEGHILNILGDIDEKTMHQMVSPRNEYRDEFLLLAYSEYNMALKLTEEQLFDLAVEAVIRSIKARSDIAESHALLGFLYLEDDKAGKAFAEFTEALKLDPHSHDAKTGLGEALILKGHTDKAIEILSEALRSNPYPEMTYYALGRAYELEGDHRKSKDMYKRALENIIHKKVIPSSLFRCR